MKKIFSIAMCFLSIMCFSQKTAEKKPSKTDTEQWIKEKISSYSYISEDGKLKHDYTISFDATNIIIKNTLLGSLPGTNLLYTLTKIPVKDIDYISIQKKEYNVWLTIKLKDGKKVNTLYNGKPIEQNNEVEMTKSVDQVDLILSKSFNEENIPERMRKAFGRLIELYGGKPASTKEPF